ncbi:MAG: hypothetical protein AAFY38_13045 [Pseudomonadota bacterium]
MTTPFDVWAQILKAPFSGDVTQHIAPRVLSPQIKGSREIEARVEAEVASYGKQLGKILEALQVLAQAEGVKLPEIDALVAGVEAVKADSRQALRAEAEQALARLKDVDEAAWRDLKTGPDGAG